MGAPETVHGPSHPVPVGRDAFTQAMSRAATGVSVVCADGPEGRAALTVSAVASVSADPPMLLACVRRTNPLRAAVLAAGRFSVSLLAAGQAAVADACAGRGPEVSGAVFVPGATGLPVVAGAAATFECELHAAHEAGSHTILVGLVTAAAEGGAEPLLHHARAYGRPAPLSSPQPPEALP